MKDSSFMPDLDFKKLQSVIINETGVICPFCKHSISEHHGRSINRHSKQQKQTAIECLHCENWILLIP